MRNMELTENEALIVTMRRELDERCKYGNSLKCGEHCDTVGEWIEDVANTVMELVQGLTEFQEDMWEQFPDMRQQFREELLPEENQQ